MPKLTKIYKVDTRDQVSCLVQLVGSQKRTLIDTLEGIKPAVLSTGVIPPVSGYADLGIYFQVYRDRKYLLQIDAGFITADLDADMSIYVISSDIVNSASQFGYSIDDFSVITPTTDIDPGDNGVGIMFSPGSEHAVTQGYGRVFFEPSENAVISIKFSDGAGNAAMLAGSSFTLTEIMNND